MFERIPLAKWVNDSVRHITTEYGDALDTVKENVDEFVQSLTTFLLDPNPVMLAMLVMLTVLVGAWLSGKWGNLARRYEKDASDRGALWSASVYAGVGLFSALVMGINFVLHALAWVGMDVGALHRSLSPWNLVWSFTLAGSLVVLGSLASAKRAGIGSVLANGLKSGGAMPVLAGNLASLVTGYVLVFAFWTLLASPAVGPVEVMYGLFVLISLLTGGWRLALFAFLGLGLIINIELWTEAMQTLALVAAAGISCIVAGIPLGIAMSRSERVTAAVRPVLDLMQTMPAFVYLIPGIAFFGVGEVPALVATFVFALPPVVRLTSHGIQEVDTEVVEASDAFGATSFQTLSQVQLPLARRSIMVGVNQTLLLSLSMVVIASMIGADGLGKTVLKGLSQVDAGIGFEGGISIVILAVLIDRVTQAAGSSPAAADSKSPVGWITESIKRFFRSAGGSKAGIAEATADTADK